MTAVPESPFPLLDTLKRGASVLRAAGVPFAAAFLPLLRELRVLAADAS